MKTSEILPKKVLPEQPTVAGYLFVILTTNSIAGENNASPQNKLNFIIKNHISFIKLFNTKLLNSQNHLYDKLKKKTQCFIDNPNIESLYEFNNECKNVLVVTKGAICDNCFMFCDQIHFKCF